MPESKIAAKSIAHIGDFFNPQQQFSANWPSVPTVAQSYLEQLDR